MRARELGAWGIVALMGASLMLAIWDARGRRADIRALENKLIVYGDPDLHWGFIGQEGDLPPDTGIYWDPEDGWMTVFMGETKEDGAYLSLASASATVGALTLPKSCGPGSVWWYEFLDSSTGEIGRFNLRINCRKRG